MYAVSNLTDGVPVSFRQIAGETELLTGESVYSELPDYPVWSASSSNIVSDQSKYDAVGFPIITNTPPANIQTIQAKLISGETLTSSEMTTYLQWLTTQVQP